MDKVKLKETKEALKKMKTAKYKDGRYWIPCEATEILETAIECIKELELTTEFCSDLQKKNEELQKKKKSSWEEYGKYLICKCCRMTSPVGFWTEYCCHCGAEMEAMK